LGHKECETFFKQCVRIKSQKFYYTSEKTGTCCADLFITVTFENEVYKNEIVL